MLKNAFYFILKAFSFSRYLNYFLDFLIMYKNGLIRKKRLYNNCHTHIAKYLKKQRQSDKEIRSVNRM